MHKHAATVRTYFAKLGLETEVADLYLSLHADGPQNISQLSRNSGVERTRIYRLVDSLLDSNLIELESHGQRGIMKAAPIANLSILIKKREEELRSLQDELGLIEQVLGRNSLSTPAVRLQSYQDLEGIQQILENQIRANSERLAVIHESLPKYVGPAYWASWRSKLEKQGKEDQWLTAKPPVLHSIIIYDDVVAHFIQKDRRLFGLEIYSPEIAASQRQLFELQQSSLR